MISDIILTISVFQSDQSCELVLIDKHFEDFFVVQPKDLQFVDATDHVHDWKQVRIVK